MQPLSQQCDAIFVTTTDETDKEQLSPRGTYIIPKGASVTDDPNATFNDDQPTSKSKVVNDQTVVVSARGATEKVSGSSIMTEDDSDSETLARKNGLKSKEDLKELFK